MHSCPPQETHHVIVIMTGVRTGVVGAMLPAGKSSHETSWLPLESDKFGIRVAKPFLLANPLSGRKKGAPTGC